MKVYLVSETYRASTQLLQTQPTSMKQVKGYRNSTVAFQLLLHQDQTSHYVLNEQYSIPDSIETPIFRVEIDAPFPVEASFVEYYVGQGEIAYADKLLTVKSHTYNGDRYAPVYIEMPITKEVKAGTYEVKCRIYQAGIVTADQLVAQCSLTIEVEAFEFPMDVTTDFNLDIWQQPSNLARQFEVDLWSEEHFSLIKEMAQSLRVIGQKAITVIAGEIPWKGWFNYIIKDYPANLYEYSMVKVRKNSSGEMVCDFDILKKYLACFFVAGIQQEINVFGLLGVWQPPFFPLIKKLDYPEKLVVRYYDESLNQFAYIEQKNELKSYMKQVFDFFHQENLWEKVRIVADEPKAHEVPMFKESVAALKEIAPDIQFKVAFDKENVLRELLPEIDYPVTSYYCTCQHYEELSQSHEGKTQYYICNYPDKPNTFLHSPLLETRLQGILAYHFKTNGLLRWAYNCWPIRAKDDIRYNTTNLPIGDLCLVYPSVSGHMALSLRYKQLYRGIEDFYLIKEASKINLEQVEKTLASFLKETDTTKWMTDSHHTNQELMFQEIADFDELREKMITVIQHEKND